MTDKSVDHVPGCLTTRSDEGVLTITLNRPERRNALSGELLGQVLSALRQAQQDPGVRVVVFAASGTAFCAGHDLRELRAADRRQREQLFAQCGELMQAVAESPLPTLAQVQGMATAAGCQLVASCDLAIAAEEASFATPGVDIGLFCSTPAVALTRTVAPKHALRMLLTGEPISARRAAEIGLVNEVVPSAELSAAVTRLATTLAGKSRAVVAYGKQLLLAQQGQPLAQAYAVASRAMVENLEFADAAEGIDAFLGKRQPAWRDG